MLVVVTELNVMLAASTAAGAVARTSTLLLSLSPVVLNALTWKL
jgi:hypothetical protein